ncbi:Rab GTPase activator and protein kinase, putative [Plasmodium vivax]|uniref:Rab GTPase activator and protein kinase, putative n=1 Tax=Plasmodium vivax TaxID=5855 RepID=A0A564ZPI1_PLAVI|nr:Rab GTPase activator and protein kinase, putative [Plasmodium vivax]
MFHARCQSSELLLGIQSYSLDEGKRRGKRKTEEVAGGEEPSGGTERGDRQSKYSSIASRFEKVKRLNHPNVCSYFSLSRRGGDFVLVSEWYSLSLHDLLREEERGLVRFKFLRGVQGGGAGGGVRGRGRAKRERPTDRASLPREGSTPRRKLIDAHTTKEIIRQILSAVHYLHSKEVKLLNLTLKDVLVTPKGRIKLHNYCASYLFGGYCCAPRDRCGHFFRSTLGRVPPQEEASPHVEGGSGGKSGGRSGGKSGGKSGGEKKGSTQVSTPRAGKRLVGNALYLPPFFLLNHLASGKRKGSSNYDVCKHVDLFSVGIIILQMVNGIFGFDFLVRNCQPLCDEPVRGENPLLNELHEIVGTLQRMGQESEEDAGQPSGTHTHGDANSLYIDTPAEGEGPLEKVKTIFVCLLYTKAYLLFADVGAQREVSLLDVNVYSLFRALGGEQRRKGGGREDSSKNNRPENRSKNRSKKGYAHANLLAHRVAKSLIELLLNVSVSGRFVKWVERILSEFFTLHVLEQNVQEIMHPGDAHNEKVLFFNLLHKCLSLRGGEQHGSSSLLSHPYFYPRGGAPSWPRNEDILMKQWGGEQPQGGGTPRQGESASTCLSHWKKEQTCEATHCNQYVVEYIRSNTWEDQLQSKHFMMTKDIHLWFGVLYRMNYFEELLLHSGVNKACSILRLPYLAYKKKKQFFDFFFFRFYELLLLGRYQGVLSVYFHLTKGDATVGTSHRFGNFRRTYRRGICRADSPNGGTCTNGYAFFVKGRKRPLMGRRNNLRGISHRGGIFTRDKTLERKWVQTNGYPSGGGTIAKGEKPYGEFTSTHEEGSAHSFFFNIPMEAKYASLPLRECGEKRVLGVRLVEFYDALEDAHRLVESKEQSGGNNYPVGNVTCVYEKEHSFLHQYSLHLKLQKLLTLDPLNRDELEKEVRRGFPGHMRGVAYLTLLGYRYFLLVRQAPGKKHKMRRLICEASSNGGATSSVKRLGENPLDSFTREERSANFPSNWGSKWQIHHSSGNTEGSTGRRGEGEDAKEGTLYKHPISTAKQPMESFLRKRRRYNDLVGSPQFAKKMRTIELLLYIKLGVSNKHLRSLLLPLCLLYYDSTYLCYKCSKGVVQKYLMGLLSSERNWREFAYTFNCLLSYYAPELTLLFFKNGIHVERLVYSWVCSLFANFFNAQSFFWLLDRILTQPRCYLFFVCVSILISLKRHIVMNMCRENFYKHIFSLAPLVNLNFVLKTSMDMFSSCPMTQVGFPRVGSGLGEETNTPRGVEKNLNGDANLLGSERAHINYLPYLIGDANWVRYYVHRDTFRVYRKRGGGSGSASRTTVKSSKGAGEAEKLRLKKLESEKLKLKKLHLKKLPLEKVPLQKLQLEKLELKKIKRKKLNDDDSGGSGHFANLPAPAQEDQRADAQWGKAKTRRAARHCELFLRNYKINKKKKNLSEFSHYETDETDVVTNGKSGDKQMGKNKNVGGGAKCAYYKLTNKNVKKKFKREDLVRLCNFPMFPFVYVTDLANEVSLDNYLIVDMRSPEEFKKKRLKHSVHVNAFLINFKKGVYVNYTDGSYDVDTHLKTIILAFGSSVLDFDAIYNFLNLKIKRITILWGGLHCAFSGLPASCFT